MHLMMTDLEMELGQDFYKVCSTYVQAWQLPKARSENLPNMFSQKRKESNREANSFKATASEGLSLHAIFACCLMTVVMPLGVCNAAIEAYMRLSMVLELLHAVPMQTVTTPVALKAAIEAFMDAALAAGWKHAFHPKWHWQLHMPLHLKRWGILPSCFTHERKHKVAKRFGSRATNTVQYEKTILYEVLGHCFAELQEPGLFQRHCTLKQQCHAPQRMKAFLQAELGYAPHSISTCAVAQVKQGSITKGDVVLISPGLEVAEVWFHAEVDGRLLSLVSAWRIVKLDSRSCICKKEESPLLISTESIQCSVAFCCLEEDLYRVLIPLPYRP